MRLACLVLAAVVLAGCGGAPRHKVLAVHVKRCAAGAVLPLGSEKVAYAGIAAHGVVAYRTPGGAPVARFGAQNANGYQTVLGITGALVTKSCAARWYHVQLPVKPNGSTGWVRARTLAVATVATRISIDVSARRLTLYDHGGVVLTAPVAVGSPATPTPLGRYYVNQRLVPEDPRGPFGPGAMGISAFSNVLTGWTQGGPVAIHGTNEPWSIGHAVSNGCIRLPNAILNRIWPLAVAGTPVIIRA
jgi:lipoprotein-anchoring transpeptidase ErfK/SrfK